MLAQSLVTSPSILFLDESLNGVSKKDELQIIKNIFNLYPQICILSITHRLTEKDFVKNKYFACKALLLEDYKAY